MPIKSIKTKITKKVVVKRPVRAAAKKAPKSVAATAKAAPRSFKKSLVQNVLGLDGKVTGKAALPSQLFAAKVNPKLMAQAVRVYLANQREGAASTKTRGEVEGSTRKIYRQKGTGRARHGGIRAPIFVGGGIVFGPKPRNFRLSLPQKMKRAALASALTSKREEGDVIIVEGLPTLKKTKNMAKTLENIGATDKPLLLVTREADSVVRVARNIAEVEILPVQNLSTYAVLAHPKLVFMKEALPVLSETFIK